MQRLGIQSFVWTRGQAPAVLEFVLKKSSEAERRRTTNARVSQ
ncbi:hypothetical protein SAMN04488117_11057 [Celeribacter baekdonensis]|jgi:hypothetical protein|uniref:Uncharacterized protein n=1 Tax=Celeribacter baekdonensis TaxID=875171 RepID=A0A1G7QSG3_9RHOB|nr:hypothetical protein SAMN04488117_11057 [Celeribacter baekdonensis]